MMKASVNALPAGGVVDKVLDLVDGLLRSEHGLAVRVDDRAAVIHRNDGAVIGAHTDEHRWTTPEMLQTETRLLTGALQRRATGTGLPAGGAPDAAIASRPSLAEEQAQMVRPIGSSETGRASCRERARQYV